MTKTIQEELLELSTIPILENELMWIARVIDEQEPKQLPSPGDSESPE
jgi:hypothetical protein